MKLVPVSPIGDFTGLIEGGTIRLPGILPNFEYSRNNPKMLRFATSTKVAIVTMEAEEKTSSPPFSRNEERKSAETMTKGTVTICEKIEAMLIPR